MELPNVMVAYGHVNCECVPHVVNNANVLMKMRTGKGVPFSWLPQNVQMVQRFHSHPLKSTRRNTIKERITAFILQS
jgi:hypothetical protein